MFVDQDIASADPRCVWWWSKTFPKFLFSCLSKTMPTKQDKRPRAITPHMPKLQTHPWHVLGDLPNFTGSDILLCWSLPFAESPTLLLFSSATYFLDPSATYFLDPKLMCFHTDPQVKYCNMVMICRCCREMGYDIPPWAAILFDLQSNVTRVCHPTAACWAHPFDLNSDEASFALPWGLSWNAILVNDRYGSAASQIP